MEKIVLEILAGKKGASSRFYFQFAPEIRRYLSTRVKESEDVEELLQDTFMSALDSLATYRGEASIKNFLYAIARHELADWYRKRYVRKAVEKTAPLFEGIMESMADPEWILKKSRLKKRFMKAYWSLSESHRDVLSYRYELGMTVAQIAEKLEMPFKATESLLYRARGAFRMAYDEIRE